MKTTRLITLFVLSSLFSANSFSSISEYLTPHKLKGKIKEEIAELDIGFKLKQNLELTEGLNTLISYRYRVEPTFQNKFYTRIDQYELKGTLSPGDLIKENLPVYVNIEKGASIVFARFIKGQREALQAKPLIFAQIPINAERFDKLPEGTLASIPTNLNLTVGAQAFGKAAPFQASVGTYYTMVGRFNIHVLKLDKNRARLRVFSEKSKSYGLSGELGIDLSIFKIDLANKLVKKVIDDDLVNFGFNKSSGQFVLFDYILDMSKPKVRESYNNILSSTLKFRRLKVLNPINGGKGPEQLVVSDFTNLEEIARADREETDKRVIKVIAGVDSFQTKSSRFGLNLSIFDFRNQKGRERHHFKFTEGLTEEQNLLMHSRSYSKKRGFALGFRKEKYEIRYFVLSTANQNGEPTKDGLINFGLSEEHKEKNMNTLEQEIEITDFSKRLPPEIYNLIDWTKVLADKTQKNVRSFLRITLNSKIKNVIKSISEQKMSAAFFTYIDWLRDSQSAFLRFRNNEKSIYELVTQTKTLVVSHQTAEQREQQMKNFIELTSKKTFKDIGFGAILSAIASEKINGKKIDLQEIVNVDFKWSSNIKSYQFSYGLNDRAQIMRSLDFIINVIQNGNSFDFHIIEYNP